VQRFCLRGLGVAADLIDEVVSAGQLRRSQTR